MNQKGGYAKSLRCVQNHSPVVNCMLKNRFLEHSEHYTLRFEDFVLCEDTNLFPPIDALQSLVEVVRFDGGFPNGMGDADIRFRGNFTSVSGFVTALDDFLFRFSVTVLSYGVAGALSWDGVAFPRIGTVAQNEGIRDTSGTGFPKEGRIISCFITDDGRLGFRITREFSDNFYLELHPLLRKVFGFPQYLFTYQTPGFVPNTLDSHLPTPGAAVPGFEYHELFDGVEYHDSVEDRIGNDARPNDSDKQDTLFHSLHHVGGIDRRLSLDVTATLPIARRINVTDEKETHDCLLARFHFKELNSFDVRMFAYDAYTGHGVTERTIIGQDELTRGSFDTEALQLLPGNIQQITLQLFVRYRDEDNIITSQLLPLDQGYWSCTMQFIKKT